MTSNLRTRIRSQWTGPALLLLLAGLYACAVNPVTGRRQLMLISSSEEMELGIEADKDIVTSYGLYPDEELAAYIDTIGQPMARDSHRPELNFSFKVLDSPVINAFAVPGGFVYVTRGILPYLGSEAELAGIIGHEIGHITARHSAARISKARLAALGLGVGSALSETFSKYSRIAEVGVGLLMLSFSRKDEREADRLGVEYSTKHGHAAAEMANFFATLERMSPKRGGGLPDWLSTHPAPEKRVETIRQLAEEWRGKVVFASLTVNRDAFLRRIDGIIYGPDPRQGYVLEGWFYHPELYFQFPLPGGWAVQNEASRVQITSSNEEALILLTLGSHESPRAEASAFIEQLETTPIENQGATVNGLPARRVMAEVTSGRTVVRFLSYFIQKGEHIYVFHGLTEKADYAKYAPAFESTMGGFSSLSDPRRIDVEPHRLSIRSAPWNGTLREVLLSLGTPEERLEELSLINGKMLDQTVEAGARLKIVEFH